MILKLTTNGMAVPPNFPSAQYEKVHECIHVKFAGHTYYGHYGGAWNALAYRYQASVDHGKSFVDTLTEYGATPPPPERYLQEKALFDFFGASFSCFESAFYALFAIGAFLSLAEFDLSAPRSQQQVSPNKTRDALARAFPGDPILTTIQDLFNDTEYQKIRETRNILTHRTAPGRTIYLSLGSDDMLATEWKLNNSAVDATIVTKSEQELSRLLGNLIAGIEQFVRTKI